MGISLQPILCERDWLFLLLVVSFFIDVNFINKKQVYSFWGIHLFKL